MHVGTISGGDIAKGWKWDGSNLVVKGDVYITNGDIAGTPASYVHGWQYGSTTYINGGSIQANTVTADKFNVHGANMLGNAGFETGAASDWTSFVGFVGDGGTAGVNCHSGRYRYDATGNGTNQAVAVQSIYIQAGAQYYAAVWVKPSTGTSGTAGGYIDWLDASGAIISSSLFATTLVAGSYSLASGVFTAPSTARTALFYLTTRYDVASGYVYFDDAEFYRADGRVLVGTPGSSRVEINSNGIEGYDSSNTKQFYLQTSDGKGYFGGGKDVLDSTGLILSGAETSYNTYNAVRWMNGSTEVARIAAGMWNSTAPQCDITATGNSTKTSSRLSLQALDGVGNCSSSMSIYATNSLGSILISSHTPTISTTGISVNVGGGSGDGISFLINGTTQMFLNMSGGLNVGSATGAGTGDGLFSGKVGVGTSGPVFNLHATGNNSNTWSVPTLGVSHSTNAFLLLLADSAVNNAIIWDSNRALRFGTGGSTVADPDAAFSEKARLTSDGKFGLGLTPSYQLQLSSDSAAKPSTNTWTIASDARLKRDIMPFTDGLAVLRQVNPIRYTYNGLAGMPESEGIGVIGQEMEKVAPYTARRFKAKLKPDDAEETELVGFNSHALTFVLINAVKELDSRLSAIERGRNQ